MRLVFVGDISLGDYYTSFGHGPRSYAEDNYVFSEIEDVLRGADIVVGNLEAPISCQAYDSVEPEEVVLRASPHAAQQLERAGFNLVQIANNHIVQHGAATFSDTIRTLEEHSIHPVGLSRATPTVVQADGVSVGFLAASDVPDNTDRYQSSYQVLDEEFIERVKQSVSSVDHLVVLLHWGLESSTKPLDYQREISERLRKAGVRMIVGSHPHLFYEIEKGENYMVAYSLGNFVFDLCWDDRLTKTGILDVVLSEGQLHARCWPVTIQNNGCLPTLTGDAAIEIENRLELYDLRTAMRWQQVKKLFHFCKTMHQGNRKLKTKFLLRKLRLYPKYSKSVNN